MVLFSPAETLVGPGVGTPLPVGTGGGPGYVGGSYGGPSAGPVYGTSFPHAISSDAARDSVHCI